MSFEVFMQVWCLQKSKLWWKQGKTGKKNQDSAIFAQHIPCVNLLLCQFSKMHALGPFPKSQCEFHRNANLVRTLCEFVFGTNFQNHALCLGIPQECEIFAQHKVSCEICTSSLKVVFSSPNAKLLLHFSQHLSSDHPIPSLNPFSSSFPILSTTMAAHLHSSTP